MKKKFLPAIILFCSANLALAGVNSIVKSEATNKIVLSLKFSQGLPSTVINIENQKVPLLVDSGASKYSIVLSKFALKNFRVKYTGKLNCSNTISGKICMKEFIIPTLKINDIIFHDVVGSELNKLWGDEKGFVETEASKNGLIGWSFLKKFNVLLDYKNHKMVFTKYNSYPQNINIQRCFRTNFSSDKGIMVNFIVGYKKTKLLIDTGSNLSYIKSSKINQKILACNDKYSKAIKNCHYSVIKLFNATGYNISSGKLYISDMNIPFDGILGGTFLQNHLAFIDSENNFFYIC